MSDYETLAQVPLGDNILAQIAGTARDIIAARNAVAEAEQELKDRQHHLRVLQEQTLPELMAEAGQTDLTTIDGLKISVKELVRGQPSKEKELDAIDWLRANGQGGIVKTKLEADLGKASDDKVLAAMDALTANNIPARKSMTVHHQTLGAVVREMLAEGKDVPLDLLGIRVWKQAEVKVKG